LDLLLNNQEAQRTQNTNDERLAQQYETQIRALQNQFIITKAILDAELANAQLMVAIKRDMNRKEDIADLYTKQFALRDARDAGDETLGDEIKSVTDKILALEDRTIEAAMSDEITTMTALVEERSAIALTIESRVAAIEATIRLSAAEASLAELDAQNKSYEAEITRFEILSNMGNSEAAGNVTRLQGRMAENDEFRDEAKAAIADIKDSSEKSQRAGAVAEQLAKGGDADVQAVIDNAP
jgi:hypothetical protein